MSSSKLIVSPTESVIFNAELPRLSASVSKLLASLKINRTVEGLHVFETSLEKTLSNSLIRVSYSGYDLGAKQVATEADNTTSLRLRRDNVARASQATKWIVATTAGSLDIQAAGKMSVKKALSKARSEDIATNELRLGFYRGIRTGWKLNPSARKGWDVADEHDKDDICDENMEEGLILPDEAFISGDMEPPAHIKCACRLYLVMVSEKALSRLKKLY